MTPIQKLLVVGVALAAFPAVAAPPAGDPALGKKAFVQCQACHAVEAKAPPRVGPTLAGVYGAKAGAKAGYAYSAALKGANLKWDDATLDRWLMRPSAVAKGTKMAFAGVPDPKSRAHLIAYIKTLK